MYSIAATLFALAGLICFLAGNITLGSVCVFIMMVFVVLNHRSEKKDKD